MQAIVGERHSFVAPRDVRKTIMPHDIYAHNCTHPQSLSQLPVRIWNHGAIGESD